MNITTIIDTPTVRAFPQTSGPKPLAEGRDLESVSRGPALDAFARTRPPAGRRGVFRCGIPLAGMILGLLGAVGTRAHFPILIHDALLGATNGMVTVTYAVGHPFELEVEPASRPERMAIMDPQGRLTNVTTALQQTVFRSETNAVAWQFRFEPSRGDSVIALDSAAEVDENAKTLYREYVKVFVHRAAQDGWANRTGQPLEVVPLTRPYGLKPAMAFSGRVMKGSAPVANTEVYFERLNERRPAPDRLPTEPLITFAVRTDDHGRFVLSFPEAGWWVVGAYVDDLGPVKHGGKEYRQEGFAGLWLKVESP
ncbi:MAG: DUF4198 domain-containing protein [Verrucomicrobia bacterium]|nr:DUF4198 domain-containing protein [Verrucomicrobiota bacterium]